MTWSLIFILTITFTSSQSNNSKVVKVDCNNDYCKDTIIDCDQLGNGTSCYIYCAGFTTRRRRNLLSTYTCSGHTGCCGSTIYCAKGEYCYVDCDDGCNNVTIHAEDAKYLKLNCNRDHSEDGKNYCGNMNIYCPRDGRGDNTASSSLYGVDKICTIQTERSYYDIENSNIYTEEGFDDLDVQDGLDVVCYIYVHVHSKFSYSYCCHCI